MRESNYVRQNGIRNDRYLEMVSGDIYNESCCDCNDPMMMMLLRRMEFFLSCAKSLF